MKIYENIGQERYFQISGVNKVFAGLWVGKAIFWATPVHLFKGGHSMIKSFYITVFFILVLMISGCTSWQKNYGKLKIVPKGQNEVTIQTLTDKWEDYNIYYAGRDDRFPLGVIFDPKNNDTTLQGDRWKNVEDKEMLLKILDRIKRNVNYYPRLREILGPDGRFYGYLYHSYGPAVFKRIDDKKMYVFDLEDPDNRDRPDGRGLL